LFVGVGREASIQERAILAVRQGGKKLHSLAKKKASMKKGKNVMKGEKKGRSRPSTSMPNYENGDPKKATEGRGREEPQI